MRGDDLPQDRTLYRPPFRRAPSLGCGILLVLLGEATAQTPGPPPTSGNVVTIVLGLTAFSLIVIYAGFWMIRALRVHSASARLCCMDEALAGASSGAECGQCGGAVRAGGRVCPLCGAELVEPAQ